MARTLDRSRPFGQVCGGSPDQASFQQDGLMFDVHGNLAPGQVEPPEPPPPPPPPPTPWTAKELKALKTPTLMALCDLHGVKFTTPPEAVTALVGAPKE